MAVHAANLALPDFGAEPGEPDLATSQQHDACRLRPDVVELEHAHVDLAAVDATRGRQDIQREDEVALLGLGSPDTLTVDAPRAEPPRRPPSVAVGAHDLALRHL